mmetsp:Transcript_96005/g.260639  ORF Transcript_96005/g.260639 Transcript_96005/m.260639 type:complete len:263 (-) Transcript_96005:29-817(-)
MATAAVECPEKQADAGAAALGLGLLTPWLLAAAALLAVASVAEVPRVVLGFLTGCCACALLRPPPVWRAPLGPGACAEEPLREAQADDVGALAGAPLPEPSAPHVAGPGDGRSGRGQRRPRSSALCAQVAGRRPPLPDGCTMLVLSGLPRRCGQEQLAERLRGTGYRDDVDLVHLPVGLKTARHMGYAILGFRTGTACERFATEFHFAGRQALFPDEAAAGILEVAPSPCKGRAEYCRRLDDILCKAKQSQRRPELLPLLLD